MCGSFRKRIQVARLVLETFVGPQPKGRQIGRKNWDHTDDRLSNLYYANPAQIRARFYRVCETSSRGELHPRHILTEERVRALRKGAQVGANVAAMARAFGVHPHTAWKAIKRQSWKHVA